MAWVNAHRPAGFPRNFPINWHNAGVAVTVASTNGDQLSVTTGPSGFVATHTSAAGVVSAGSSLDFRVQIEMGSQRQQVPGGGHYRPAAVGNVPMPSGKYCSITNAMAFPMGQGIGAVLLVALCEYAQRHGVTWIRTGTTANPWWQNFMDGDPLNPSGDFNDVQQVLFWAQGRAAARTWNNLAPITAHNW